MSEEQEDYCRTFSNSCCIPFAWKLMLPDPLENFGQSLVATSIFSNNILLFVTSGYWDLPSEFKPLLHMEPWCGGTILHFISIVTFVHMEVWVKYFFLYYYIFGNRELHIGRIRWYLDKDITKLNGDLNSANFYLIPFRALEILIDQLLHLCRKHHIVKTAFELLGIL